MLYKLYYNHFNKIINSFVLKFAVVLCLLLPKFNLIPVPGFYQGIRFEDLFIVFMFFIILANKNLHYRYFPGSSLYFLFYGYLLFVGLINIYNYGLIAIVLPLKWIEYSLFYVLLHTFCFSINTFRVTAFICIYANFIVSILQRFKLIGGIYSNKSPEIVSSRIPGLTGGSWELPLVLTFFLIPLLFDSEIKNKYKLLTLLVCSYCVFVSGTRGGMIGFMVAISFYLFKYIKFNKASLLFIPIIIIYIFSHGRMNFLFDYQIPLSLQFRLDGWHITFETMNMFNYYFGNGLGSTGVYADGLYAKIFLDLGIFGLIIFFLYYYLLFKDNVIYFIILCITSISLDVVTASKAMFALYFSLHYMRLIKINKKLLVHSATAKEQDLLPVRV